MNSISTIIGGYAVLTNIIDHILKETVCQCKHKVCHLSQNSPHARATNWTPASSHAFPVDGGTDNLPPLERALPYLVDTLYEELDSLTRLLAARPLGSLTPRDLEVIGHLIKVSSDFRTYLQQSAPSGHSGPPPDREPAEERPCSLVCVPPRPITTSTISADDASEPRIVDGGSYQPTAGHNLSASQKEDRLPASGPLDPLPSRDGTVLLPCPALDSKDKPVECSHSNQGSRTFQKLRFTSKLQPMVSRYMIIVRRLLTKVVSDRRRP